MYCIAIELFSKGIYDEVEEFMNERNLKRLGYVGLVLQIIASAIMMGIVAIGLIFDIYSIIPDFVMDLFWVGLIINLISVFLRGSLKRHKNVR